MPGATKTDEVETSWEQTVLSIIDHILGLVDPSTSFITGIFCWFCFCRVQDRAASDSIRYDVCLCVLILIHHSAYIIVNVTIVLDISYAFCGVKGWIDLNVKLFSMIN